MDVLQKMVSTQAVLFLYIAAGIVCRLVGIMTAATRRYFNALLVYVTLPAMIFASFMTRHSLKELTQAGMMLVVSACVCLAPYGLSLLLWRKAPQQRQGTLRFATMFSNAGNAGLPVVSMVFGDAGVLYASFFLIPMRVFMWTLGLSFFIPSTQSGRIKKLMTNPSFIAVFAGLLAMLCPVALPAAVQSAVRGVGNMTGPLSMMIIGSTLSEMRPRDMLDRDALLVSIVRLILLPLALLGTLRLTALSELGRQVSVTLTAMPVATLTAVFSDTYGGDYCFASRCVFLSTVISLITVPIVTLLF